MAPLGPFGPHPRLAVGVSGGGDSMALAWLARRWAAARGGAVLALIVDHGLRPESAAEAAAAAWRLAAAGIGARRLRLDPPPAGPDLSTAARAARHAALQAACRAEGIVFLLLAHTRADQAETQAYRALRGSGSAGLAAMAARRETAEVALLRPLLAVPPGVLRATCRAAGLAWAEDPTNRDPRFARARLRAWFADPLGAGPAIAARAGAAFRLGAARARAEAGLAGELASLVELRPQGFALVARPDALGPAAAARLVACIGGDAWPPPAEAALALLRRGRGTLSGVVAGPAGRLGDGVLLAREAAAVAPPRAVGGAVLWDRRWRVEAPAEARLIVGALGGDLPQAARRLPARVASMLPALRDGAGRLVAAPSLGYAEADAPAAVRVVFAPPEPLAGAAFLPAPQAGPGAG